MPDVSNACGAARARVGKVRIFSPNALRGPSTIVFLLRITWMLHSVEISLSNFRDGNVGAGDRGDQRH